MENYFLFVSLITGFAIGSFLNVCIFRIPKKLSVVSPPSKCLACDNRLSVLENIPIISYLFLKGKCRNCGTHISIIYPIVEFITGVLTIFTFYYFGLNYIGLLYVLFIYVLIIIAFIDINEFIIPNSLLIFGLILIGSYQLFGFNFDVYQMMYGVIN